MIITILAIVGGVWSWNKGWVRGKQVRNVAGTASALLQLGVRRHFIRKIISPKNYANIAFESSFGRAILTT